MTNSTWICNLQQEVPVISLIQLFEMFKPAAQLDSIQVREVSLRKFWVSSPRTDLKLTKPINKQTNITPMQSNKLNLMKISKSCSKVIQRTLRSGKKWLRCSSFSTLSRVKWARGRKYGELWKSSFWKYLFPWSDRLDQKRVLNS